MKSMKRLAALLFAAAFVLPGGALAQDYYTLPEIREQAAQGWHETYTDKYGRTRQVDVDIEVFGDQTAPVVKACWGDPPEYEFIGPVDGDPSTTVLEARVKGKGVSIEPYELVRGMRLDLNQKYAEEFGNDMTMGEVYDFLDGLLKEQGCDQRFVLERPYMFSILYSAREDTGEVLIPAMYTVYLWQEEFGLPILTNVGWSFRECIGPRITPGLLFSMRDPTAYLGGADVFDVDEVLAQDIPLCSVDKVIEGARGLIEGGYIQQVLSLRFGYVVYGDPDEEYDTRKSGEDMNTWYLVPSWVMECYVLEDPKVDELPEYPMIWEMTINAQTGEMADYLDTSFFGRGDLRYKGFIPWDNVK